MMYIDWQEGGAKVSRQWHTGEPFPAVTGRVITLTVDGDELEFLLRVIRKAAKP